MGQKNKEQSFKFKILKMEAIDTTSLTPMKSRIRKRKYLLMFLEYLN